MDKILIDNQKRRELNNWLTFANNPAPTWLGIKPSPCVYVLFTENNNKMDCCDARGTLIIPSNGYSVKVGKNNNGPEAAIKINYSQGPVRPCGSDDKVFNEVIEFIIIFDPKSLKQTPKQLKDIIKDKVKALIEQYFTTIPTNSRDWHPFITGDRDLCDIIKFLENFKESELNIALNK